MRAPNAKKPAPRKIELPKMVEEGVALLGRVAQLQDDLAKAGLDKAFPMGRQITLRHQELATEWNRYAGAGLATDEMALMLGLYQRCRDTINMVQSSLQNLIRPRGQVIMVPVAEGALASGSTQLLADIVRAKENWAYIDAHPQVVIARAAI